MRLLRLRRKESRAQREANEARLERLLDDFRSLGLDPIVIGDSSPAAVLRRFSDWADARLANRRGEWR